MRKTEVEEEAEEEAEEEDEAAEADEHFSASSFAIWVWFFIKTPKNAHRKSQNAA